MNLEKWERYEPPNQRRAAVAKAVVRLIRNVAGKYPESEVEVRLRSWRTVYINAKGISTEALRAHLIRPGSRPHAAMDNLRQSMMPHNPIRVSFFIRGDRGV